MTELRDSGKTREDLTGQPILTVLGMMSGTSMDGIDVALIRTDGGAQVQKLICAEYPFDAAFKARLEQSLEDAEGLTNSSERNEAVTAIELEITNRHADAVDIFLKNHGLKTEDIDAIGFHGQTVLHRPELGFTVQLGDGKRLAAKTGIPVVYDMRSNDMKFGGQGAPLVPVFHQALSAIIQAKLPENYQTLSPVAFVNIGGISNLTYIGEDGELIAFDTGPGNALIDQWVQAEAGIQYDQNGAIASEGMVLTSVAESYLGETFFEQTAPKSLDRNDFKPLAAGAASLENGARTLAYVSAAAILKSCDHLPKPPKLWIICGGGRKNQSIMKDLKKLALEKNEGEVVMAETAGLDGDSMEAEAWAYLAARSIKGLPLTFPKTTGCSHPVSGGILVFPE